MHSNKPPVKPIVAAAALATAMLVTTACGGGDDDGVTSACIEKASGSFGKVLYIVAGSGHIDISDQTVPELGRAWGVSPANGTTIFRNGAKQ
jgi:hypothetical protein